jgi:hypothetical protein
MNRRHLILTAFLSLFGYTTNKINILGKVCHCDKVYDLCVPFKLITKNTPEWHRLNKKYKKYTKDIYLCVFADGNKHETCKIGDCPSIEQWRMIQNDNQYHSFVFMTQADTLDVA